MPRLVMIGGYEVRLEAIDPTTGDPVTGVSVSQVVVNADDEGPGGGGGEAPQFLLVPGPGAGGVGGGNAV